LVLTGDQGRAEADVESPLAGAEERLKSRRGIAWRSCGDTNSRWEQDASGVEPEAPEVVADVEGF
tara:strand:+ start:422 stop:616 length:195 start_codon:yes stop_codon:yes gene_type:complete